ncbi:MAG: hypothetical protein ACPGVO_18250, partial [Spirulinaceae cyanobacterium]
MDRSTKRQHELSRQCPPQASFGDRPWHYAERNRVVFLSSMQSLRGLLENNYPKAGGTPALR